jgi:hypothetical protein
MPAEFDTARDEIQSTFKVAWDANAGAVNGGVVPTVHWEGVPTAGDFPPKDAAWARMIIRHNAATQAALSSSADRRRFRKFGILTISIFTPLQGGQGLGLAEELGKVARAAFEGKSTASGVWFRDARINEIGPDGPWFQVNVLAEFEYDEFA